MSQEYPRKNVVIAGATGFVGSALVPHLESQGWVVTSLVRSTPRTPYQTQWNPQAGEIPMDVIENADVVINLAGASIAGGWWTAKRKHLILQSRLDATSTIAKAIARAAAAPRLLISTSGVNYYGDRPGSELDEYAGQGSGFLADVCEQWERAADPAREAGTRVVHPRFGLVLDGDGGMLPIIKKPFQFGLGGKIGGSQYMSWIDLHDLVRMYPFLIAHEEIEGPVNAVASGSVTNAEFTAAMGSALNRPTMIPVPAAIVSKLGGGLVEELLLADVHAIPAVLEGAGFEFDYPSIGQSLKHAFQ